MRGADPAGIACLFVYNGSKLVEVAAGATAGDPNARGLFVFNPATPAAGATELIKSSSYDFKPNDNFDAPDELPLAMSAYRGSLYFQAEQGASGALTFT